MEGGATLRGSRGMQEALTFIHEVNMYNLDYEGLAPIVVKWSNMKLDPEDIMRALCLATRIQAVVSLYPSPTDQYILVEHGFYRRGQRGMFYGVRIAFSIPSGEAKRISIWEKRWEKYRA